MTGHAKHVVRVFWNYATHAVPKAYSFEQAACIMETFVWIVTPVTWQIRV